MLEVFDQHRSQSFSMAYRMLGSVAEAEDMVQETWLRWQRQEAAQGQIFNAIVLETERDQVRNIYIVRNPAKLRHLAGLAGCGNATPPQNANTP